MSDRRFFLRFLVGLLLVQAAWCLVVPPFRGIDEHDHAYRASAVAHGDFSPHHRPSSQGWGWFVSVDPAIVEDAKPVCVNYLYTTWDNCAPHGEVHDGLVEVASAQAQSNPVFYAVVGSVGRPFHGFHALYAMRAATALLSALLISWGAVAIRKWSRTRWPLIGLMLGCTPVLVYSTSIVASNGVEMAAGVLLWAALLGIVRSDGSHDRWLVWTATAGALPLVTLRTMGPLWCVLIAACTVVLAGLPRLRQLFRLRSAWAAVVLVALATAAACAWILTARANFIPANGHLQSGLKDELPTQYILWYFQSVAVFPTRTEFAPYPLYVVAFALIGSLTVVALIRANRRERFTFGLIWLLTSAVSVAATVAMYADQGFGWQGRYALPFAAGFFMLIGLVLDRRPLPIRDSVVLAGVALASGATELIGMLHVQHTQLRISPLSHTSEWVRVPDAVIVLLVGLGVSVLFTTTSAAIRGLGADRALLPRVPDETFPESLTASATR